MSRAWLNVHGSLLFIITFAGGDLFPIYCRCVAAIPPADDCGMERYDYWIEQLKQIRGENPNHLLLN